MAYTGSGIVFDSGMPAGFDGATAAGWTIVSQPDAVIGTTNALKSATITHLGNTQFDFVVTNINSLRIRYKVDSEANYDHFRFYIDGDEYLVDSGTTGGIEAYVHTGTLLLGTHTFTFRYSKDGSQSVATDAVYITEILLNFVSIDTLTTTKLASYALTGGAVDAEALANLKGYAVTGGAVNGLSLSQLESYAVTGGAVDQQSLGKLNAYAVIYAGDNFQSFGKMVGYAVFIAAAAPTAIPQTYIIN